MMIYPNLISTTVPDKDVKEILNALKFINEKLPDLVTLTKEELTTLPKIGENTNSFVLENLREAENNPGLVPKDVEIGEIKRDVELIKAISRILNPLKKLERKLEDSALLAGSEAYLPSIAIHNAMKADAIRRKHQKATIKV